jgi:D-alanyl-D-alanine carboxypeptidase-like protein
VASTRHREGPQGRGRWAATAAVCALLSAALAFPLAAHASHMAGWVHDHSSVGIPPKPSGYSGLVRRFGEPCNGSAYDSRSYWPSQSARGVAGYISYHHYIAQNVGYNVRNHIEADHMNGAVDYGVYGYNCRYISGTTNWSTHAFGAAIDTNSARNPMGQDHWVGIGADGIRHGRYIPNIWKGTFPGHNFYWGLKFSSNPDPMHFQYVTGY